MNNQDDFTTQLDVAIEELVNACIDGDAEREREWEAKLHALIAEDKAAAVQAVTEQKDGAYRERDALVCLLSKVFPSHLCRHDENAAVGEAALARYDEEQRQANEAKLNEQWRRKWELAVDTIAERVGVIQRMEELLRRGVALERTYGPDAVTLMATNLAWKDEVTKFLDSGKSIREVQP